ncbi:MAG TPA: hypothetical protein VEU55_08145 [Gemmatimonadales bacterium]|nr:hypothetical protein [Gemmatimonadales bacterium]
MRRYAWVLMLVAARGLVAQAPPDSGARPEAAEQERLRQQIRQRWNEHIRATLGLSDAQATQLQGTEQRYEEQRQPIRARQRELNQALNAELAAGAPNQDRVTQLMSERQQNRLKLQQLDRAEDGEMQRYLTPVQRARYQEERRQFQDRVRWAAQQHPQRRPPPRMGPRPPERRRRKP